MTSNSTSLTNSEAREIAAMWQSSGTEGIGFAQFASTGTITEALLDDIDREIQQQGDEPADRAEDVAQNLAELRALDAYVQAQTVTVWVVGENDFASLPTSAPAYSIDYASAVTAFIDLIEEAPEALCGEDDEEASNMEAHVKAFIRDEVPSVVGTTVYGEVRPLSLSLCSDAMVLPRVFWLDRTEMTVAEARPV